MQYAKGVVEELQGLGHHVQILFANRKEILQAIGGIVLHEEMTRLKKIKQTMDREQQLKFVQRWKKDNEMFLNETFGMADCTYQKQYVKGVLFAPSSSTHLVPLLQDVIQADGAHSQFGKYTLFSAYGTNANGHMSPIAFGLLFGNEDASNWSTFWTFVKTVHPLLDAPIKTILTDQEKGLIAAMKNTFKHAARFMCSFRHRQNILKTCGGGKGKKSLFWLYGSSIFSTLVLRWLNLSITNRNTTRRCTQPICTTCRNRPTNVNTQQLEAPWVMASACSVSQHHWELSQ